MEQQRVDVPPILEKLSTQYEIVRAMDPDAGGGPMVYLASERESGRLVTIRVVDLSAVEDAEAAARFAREMRSASYLNHPNIVRVHAIEPLGGGEKIFALVSQYVPGKTLREAMRDEGAFSFERAAGVLRDVATGLRYALGRGVVHGDVRPEHIVLDDNSGRALLTGFATTRAPDRNAADDPARLRYLAPERLDGEELDDGRSDIYSLGVVGWEMLAGREPWAGESAESIREKQEHESLPRLTELRPGIPEPLLFAIESALDKYRDTRWANLDEFLAQLDEEQEAAAARGSAKRDVARTEVAAAAGSAVAAASVAEPVTPGAEGRPLPRRDSVATRPATTTVVTSRPRPQRAYGMAIGFAVFVLAVTVFVFQRSREHRTAQTEHVTDSLKRAVSAGEVTRDTTVLTTTPAKGARGAGSRKAANRDSAAADRALRNAGANGERPADRAADSARIARLEALHADSARRARFIAMRADSARRATALRADSARRVALRADSLHRAAVARVDSIHRAVMKADSIKRAAAAAKRTGRTPAADSSGNDSTDDSPRVARTHEDSLDLCNTPGTANQRACLYAHLSDGDERLNRVYKVLISFLRHRDGAGDDGDPDPESVRLLRSTQREWLATREAVCARRARNAGALWGTARAQCLAEVSAQRASELEGELKSSKP